MSRTAVATVVAILLLGTPAAMTGADPSQAPGIERARVALSKGPPSDIVVPDVAVRRGRGPDRVGVLPGAAVHPRRPAPRHGGALGDVGARAGRDHSAGDPPPAAGAAGALLATPALLMTFDHGEAHWDRGA